MVEIAALADRYWDLTLANDPLYASTIGRHDYDSEIEDLTETGRNRYRQELLRLRGEVANADPAPDPITHALLEAAIDADLAEEETEILVGSVDPYIGPLARTLRFTSQTRATDPAHAAALAARFRRLPDLFAAAADRHRRLAEAGRAPARVVAVRVLDQIDAYLASGLGSDPFVNLDLPDGWAQAEQWRSQIADVVTSLIRPSLARYREVIADSVVPFARADERPGICHLEGGEEIHRRLVARFLSVPHDPLHIHQLGHTHATEGLLPEWEETGREALGEGETTVLFDRLRRDPALRYASAEEMLEHAREVVARAWANIDGWLGERPDHLCRVMAVPAEIAKDVAPAYYMPPAADGSRPGTYFLNTYRPETRDRFTAEATAFHEAVPGHHFDRALAARIDDLPDFRRFLSQNVHAEGWGLYAERLADEMGLYSGPLDRLGMLTAESWRSVRLVVDTGLHALGWTRAQAVDYFRRWSPVNLDAIDQEIDRYIAWPGQALGYQMGKLEIDRLRLVAERTLGDRFDLVAFHDTLLTSGSVTLPVLEKLVAGYIARAGAEARRFSPAE